MLAQFSKIIKTVPHQRDRSEDLKERNGRSREQVSSAYSGDYCCNLRAASVRHILLDGQISKGPIKRRDVRFCVNEACCARREARISVGGGGGKRRRGFAATHLQRSSRARSLMHRKDGVQARIGGRAHQSSPRGLVFMFHVSFMCRSVPPWFSVRSEAFYDLK